MELPETYREDVSSEARWRADDPRVHQVIHAAQLELRDLLGQRAQIVKRICNMKQTIVGLAKLYGDDALTDDLQALLGRKPAGRNGGLTHTCRIILMQSGRSLTGREVCQHLESRAPAILAHHKDPLASVTTVLNRLAHYGEARAVLQEDGRRAWEWASEAHELLSKRSQRDPLQVSSMVSSSMSDANQGIAK